MSISSYRRNVSLGVTGSDTDTCYLAALEQISPYDQLRPQTYRKYARFMASWGSLKKTNPRSINPMLEQFIEQVAWELGGLEYDEVVFERVDTYREFSTLVRKLLRHDFRVAIDINVPEYGDGVSHPVGLIALYEAESFRAVSNWLPRPVKGIVTLRDLYENLDFPKDQPRIRYPFNDANITALPPAA